MTNVPDPTRIVNLNTGPEFKVSLKPKKLPEGYSPDVKEWISNAIYIRFPDDPRVIFMEDPPVIESGGRKYYHSHDYVTAEQKRSPPPVPPIIWPFLLSDYFRPRLPVKRTYPFGFVPTTVFTGKYREDIISLYPYELQASFKHQSNPITEYWLSYITALQEVGKASYRVTTRGKIKHLEPVPLRQTGKNNFAWLVKK